ncbi:MAG: glutamate 5-kinase [Prolixibacteraceae bacterium]|jgi:glutamate 5-kinase|nr:glutamate 5-kinase [Prolixibacteraceae bacterium]
MKFRYTKITVKVGSNVLAKDDGTLNVARIAHLVDQIAYLHKHGVEVILVSSGAVAAGKAVMEPVKKADSVSRRQLWAALGQVKLISRYSDFFNEHGLVCAQVLTTKESFSSRRHYLNMKNCMSTLLENRVIPIVNENDTISVTELMFTDNDELSGLIASMVNSEALVILTDVNGVYNTNPKEKDAELIHTIGLDESKPVNTENEGHSSLGRGGMATKFKIAKKLANAGISVHVTNGKRENVLIDLLEDIEFTEHTYFEPSKKASSGVKKWIAYSGGFTKGEITINEGAAMALCSDKAASLLPVGVVSIGNEFKKGDLLSIVDEKGNHLGLGRANYGSEKLETEKQSKRQKALVHYDYLYIEKIKKKAQNNY